MHQHWIDAAHLTNGSNGDIWAVDYTAHPLLDPEFTRKRSRLLYLTRQKFRRMLEDDDSYRRELGRFFHPVDSRLERELSLKDLNRRATEYLEEADVYLAATIALLPTDNQASVTPLPAVADCRDLRQLIGLAFDGADERLSYEARRKLFLAQTLLQIDQSRHVLDGPQHREYFENLLNDGLWRHTTQIHDLSIGYHMDEDGDTIRYTARPGPDDQRWHFRSTFVEKTVGKRRLGLDILYYNCRFKRSVTPVSFEIIDGRHQVVEKVRWSEMRQQSNGSILSKMIRKGLNSPDEIADLIGAMFIVHDDEALDDLLLLLDSTIGTPFGWRNVTDTLATDTGSSLNSYSSKRYKVFKGDVDVLAAEPGATTAYRFPVEIQILTLEGYLRTVCGAHEANHLALKLRQFLYGLVPKVFPRVVYGSDWLRVDRDAWADQG